jgi:hypothetical protein
MGGVRKRKSHLYRRVGSVDRSRVHADAVRTRKKTIEKKIFFFFLEIFWLVLNAYIWCNFTWILEFIFLMNVDLSQNCIAKKNFRKLLPFFLGGWNGGQGSSVCLDSERNFLQVLNLYIWRRNDWLLKFFFVMGRYWRWDCPPKKISMKPLTNFPWRVEMRPGVQCPCGH